jgi:hypothetical protein
MINEWRAESLPSSEIFVVRDTNGADNGIERLLGLMGEKGVKFYLSTKKEAMQGPGGLIARDDIILIKVNSQWDERGGTNTDLVKNIIYAIISHPDDFTGEIIVADNGQGDQYGATGRGGSLDWERNNAVDQSQSIQDVVDVHSYNHRVSTYQWDTLTTNIVEEFAEGDEEDGYVVNRQVVLDTNTLVSYPKFTTPYGTQVSFKYGIYLPNVNDYDVDKLKVINVPVLKSHSIYGVTGAVKHYMGVSSDKITKDLGYRAHNTVIAGGMGTLMVQTRAPTLNIMDAIHVNAKPKDGPRTNYISSTELGILAASTDPVAIDYWGSKELLCKTCENVIGKNDNSMNPDNNEKGSFGDWLRLSMNELNAAGYEFTSDPKKINVWIK